MVSTSLKIAFGYLLMICLLFGAIGYIYKQMILLTAPNELEENTESRKKRLTRLSHNYIKLKSSGKPYVPDNYMNTLRTNNRCNKSGHYSTHFN